MARNGLSVGGTDGTGHHHNEHYASYTMDDVAVRDGSLHLTTQKRAVTDKKGNKYSYTDGLITTAKTFQSNYGYFEVRAKMPTQAGSVNLWKTIRTNLFWHISRFNLFIRR